MLKTKKAVIVMTLFLIFLVPSVIAVPTAKEPKPPKIPNNQKRETISFQESATLGAGNIYLGNQQISDAGILSVQNGISVGKISEGKTPISGLEIQTSLTGTYDLDSYEGNYHGQWIITGEEGTFEGNINGKVSMASIYGKFTGSGAGEFENQKIKGTFNGSVNNFQVEITFDATISSK